MCTETTTNSAKFNT